MKLKKLWLVALAAITLVGCTKEVIVEVPTPGNGGTEEVGDTYVKFSLDANMVKTRATPDDHYTMTPTADELKIYNYALFIFKSNGMLEATLLGNPGINTPIQLNSTDRDLTFTKAENPDLEWNEAGDAIRISAGAKTFFAIVNAPREYVAEQGSFVNNTTLTLAELKEITLTLGGDLNKIVGQYSEGSVSLNNPINSGNDNRGFMMTNIIADGQSDGLRRITLLEQNEDETPANVSVKVGRAMAKVSLASDLQSYDDITTANPAAIDPTQQYGTLDTKEYKIINNPNEMNVALNVVSGIVMTPYMSAPLPVNTDNYFISNNTSHEDKNYYIPVSTQAAKTYNYCIENANNTPRYGTTTIALIKGHYTPLTGDYGRAVILDANSVPVTTSLSPGEDFWRIWIDSYIDTNGDPQGNVYAEEYFTGNPDLDAYRAYRTTNNNPLPSSVELTAWAYPEGLCYYYLPLQNDESDSPYTVVRNSYYRIDIKSVDGPGYPDDPENPGEPGGPDKPEPETPIEAQTNIKAKIEVANWDAVDQKGSL